MKKVLLTGFNPFGGEKINPALEAVKLIKNDICGYKIVKLEIPTVFKKSIDTLKSAIINENPDIVICIGQAGGRYEISVERVAINLDSARIPDNEGNKPIDTPIFEDGQNAYFSNLPINAMVKKMLDNDIPSSISNTAGTFVCNHIMYGLLYLIEKEFPNIKGGFIHVPFLPKQVIGRSNMPYMSLETIIKGLEHCIETAIKYNTDICYSLGKTC
jgi:pyroglutamyl-peptidase